MKYFSIPEPCSENWAQMTETEKGAFCQKCSKEVHDVSQLSNNEIITLIATKEKMPCMRMTLTQEKTLNLDLGRMFESKQRTMQRAMLFSLLVVFGFTLFSCNDSQQIHERNLMQSAAESIVSVIDQEEVQPTEVSAIPTNVEDSTEIQTPPVQVIDPVQEIECELPRHEVMTLGEPAMYPDEVIDSTPPIEVVQLTHTMGVPMRIDTPNLQHLIKTEKDPSKEKTRNTPVEFAAIAFPNPATTFTTLNVELPNKAEKLQIRLLDLNGTVLQEINDKKAKAGKHEFRIELNDLSPAYYLIDVRFDDEHKVLRLSKAH